MKFENICIVLVEPKGSLNIGSVSRSMMNFGLSDLRLVTPLADHLNDDARRMAVKSTPILEQAKIYDTLPDALANCHFSMATTRRFGKYRDRILHPEEAARTIIPLTQSGTVGLVFGREDHGLSTSEIDHCQTLLSIPTHEGLKSINLGQSVVICLYQIFQTHKKGIISNGPQKKFASNKLLEEMFFHMQSTLEDIRYPDQQNPSHITHTFRKIFGRAKLDEREVRILHGLWSRIDWVEEQRKQHSAVKEK